MRNRKKKKEARKKLKNPLEDLLEEKWFSDGDGDNGGSGLWCWDVNPGGGSGNGGASGNGGSGNGVAKDGSQAFKKSLNSLCEPLLKLYLPSEFEIEINIMDITQRYSLFHAVLLGMKDETVVGKSKSWDGQEAQKKAEDGKGGNKVIVRVGED